MSLLKVAKSPAIIVRPETTVMDAVRAMQKAGSGAVIVVADDTINGVFTERDVMNRVVLGKKDPETTAVADVMTTRVYTVQKDARAEEVVREMWDRQVRHLPVVHVDGSVAGVVEIRDLFHECYDDLNVQLDSLEQYIAADGAGG